MTDTVLQTTRAVITVLVFFHLLSNRRTEERRKQKGWSYILIGFAILFFGMIIDITNNFLNLNKYIIISDTGYDALPEKVIGYLCGFLLLAIGFWKWMPAVITPRKTKKDFTRNTLKKKINV